MIYRVRGLLLTTLFDADHCFENRLLQIAEFLANFARQLICLWRLTFAVLTQVAQRVRRLRNIRRQFTNLNGILWQTSVSHAIRVFNDLAQRLLTNTAPQRIWILKSREMSKRKLLVWSIL